MGDKCDEWDFSHPPMQGESEIEPYQLAMNAVASLTTGNASVREWERQVEMVLGLLTAAESRGYERGIEDAAVMVEEVFDKEIATAIRSLKDKP